jgi:hypothetical protein
MSIYESSSLRTRIASNMIYGQLNLSRIIIGTMKGNVSAVNILKECLDAARDLRIREVLLALGPTSPLSLGCRPCHRILWATFLHGTDVRNHLAPVIVPPTHLTDLSVALQKLSTTKNPVRLLLGDFLDNLLPVSTDSAAFTFLCTLFTKIRESEQTAFFLLTEDMHDAKKIMMVKRFADVLIEYRNTGEDIGCEVEARIVDLTQDQLEQKFEY